MSVPLSVLCHAVGEALEIKENCSAAMFQAQHMPNNHLIKSILFENDLSLTEFNLYLSVVNLFIGI